MKCDTNVSRIQYIELCKTIRKKNEEKRKRNMEIIRTTTENNRSLKKIAKNMKNGREETTALKGGGGEIINKQDEILARIKQFYEQLYTPPTSTRRDARKTFKTTDPSASYVTSIKSSLELYPKGWKRCWKKTKQKSKLDLEAGQHHRSHPYCQPAQRELQGLQPAAISHLHRLREGF